MIYEVKLPEMSENNDTKATISFWYVKPGQKVEKDEDIVELLTDKAAFNVSAETGGVVKELRYKEGDKCVAGDVLAVIESE